MKNSIQYVPVAEYRSLIGHLNRLYFVDRCACRGDDEKQNNTKIMRSVRNKLKLIDAKRKKANDKKDYEKIMQITKQHLVFNDAFNDCFDSIMSDLCMQPHDLTELRAVAKLAFVCGQNVLKEKEYKSLVNQELANLEHFI